MITENEIKESLEILVIKHISTNTSVQLVFDVDLAPSNPRINGTEYQRRRKIIR